MGYRIDSSYFDKNEDMLANNIEDILSEDEQILWQQGVQHPVQSR